MIRINLLPVRAFKRKENVRRQVSVYLLTIVLLAGLLGWVFFYYQGIVRDLNNDKEALQTEEKALAAKVKEVQQLQQEEDDLKAKLAIIAKLERSRRGPVHILDEISKRIPAQKAYLLDMSQSKGRLTLKGVAMDNETIALFMSNLEASDYFQDVELVRSAQEIRNDLRLKGFSVNCTIVIPSDEEEIEAGKAG
jgi:type IV pilus assembly protein PilN